MAGIIGTRIAPMFEVGRSYSFAMETEHGFGTSSYKVVAWDAPLLKLASVNEEDVVVNVGSSRFHSATPVDFDAAAPLDIDALISR